MKMNNANHKFTSQEYDWQTGVYYYRARSYDAHLGRFLQQDPAGMVDGANMYAYCGNEPVGRRDPTGMWWNPLEKLGFPASEITGFQFIRWFYGTHLVESCYDVCTAACSFRQPYFEGTEIEGLDIFYYDSQCLQECWLSCIADNIHSSAVVTGGVTGGSWYLNLNWGDWYPRPRMGPPLLHR